MITDPQVIRVCCRVLYIRLCTYVGYFSLGLSGIDVRTFLAAVSTSGDLRWSVLYR